LAWPSNKSISAQAHKRTRASGQQQSIASLHQVGDVEGHPEVLHSHDQAKGQIINKVKKHAETRANKIK